MEQLLDWFPEEARQRDCQWQLAAHGRRDLASASWSPPRYEAYLDQIHVWADALGVKPETVAYLIFQAEADARGNQWATRR